MRRESAPGKSGTFHSLRAETTQESEPGTSTCESGAKPEDGITYTQPFVIPKRLRAGQGGTALLSLLGCSRYSAVPSATAGQEGERSIASISIGEAELQLPKLDLGQDMGL